MKVTTEPIERSQLLMEVEVDQEAVEASLDKAFRRLANRVNVPGFRRGKAPRHMVERLIGRSALLEEALEDLIPEIYNRTIEEQAIDAVARPRIEVTGIDPVTFKATIPIRPTVELGDYRSIRKTMADTSITEEEVQAAVERLREQRAIWEPVDRPVRMGDLLTMDIEGSIGGEPFTRQEDVQYYCIAGSRVPVPGFPEMVEGTEKGVLREFDLTLPDDYERQELAGKVSRFALTVKEIKEKRLPAVDDELARSLGEGFETAEQLHERIRRALARNKRAAALDQLQAEIVDAIVAGARLEVPPALVEHEVEHLLEEQQERLRAAQLDLARYLEMQNTSLDELRARLEPEAERRIRRSYVFQALAEQEGIQVTEAEIDAEIASIVGEEPEAGLRSFYDQSPIRDRISRQVFTRKVIDFVIALATEGAIDPAAIRAASTAELKDEAEARRAAQAASVKAATEAPGSGEASPH